MQAASGLEGIVVADTRLSHVEGEIGRLTIAGYDAQELASNMPFEAVAYLLWHDELPDADALRAMRASLGALRSLEPATLELLREASRRGVPPIDALRMGVTSLSLAETSPERLLSALPVVVASYERLRRGLPVLDPRPEGSLSAEFLRLASGEEPRDVEVWALDTYLGTVADHGFNASTFTARVVASTGSDLGASVEAALAALEGPLHGGAPGPALEALLALRAKGGDIAAETRIWAEGEISAGRRLMGFGHRVYRTRDPRADVLGEAARALLGESSLHRDAREHERVVLEVLAERKPGRVIATNVEFYTALLLHGLGFEPACFTSIFAMGRVAGWIAHCREQQAEGRLIRPRARYVGATGRLLSDRSLTTPQRRSP